MRISLILLIILFCSKSYAQTYPVSDIKPILVENADAVVRFEEMNVELQSVDKMTYTVDKVITVLNKEGDQYASTTAFYDKERKIRKIEAFVYDSSGKEINHIKKKDFYDLAAVDGFSLYIDSRLLYYRYVPIQYPYTLKFSYEIETSDTGAFPSWNFLSGYGISIEESRYKVAYPSQVLRPIIKEFNLEGISMDKTDSNGVISYNCKNIVAMKSESLSPSLATLSPRLSTRLPKFHYKGFDAKIDDWNEMGAWIDAKLLTGRSELPQSTIILAKTLVSNINDDLEKAKIIYKYVQENTRYISVQIGIGGFQPIAAVEVDRVKYGDCKGLANYTKALLEAVGVESFYAVVEAGNIKVDFETDFADLAQGNHAILAIPYKEKYYWIDCTSQIHPFGFIGDFTDDRNVLVVKSGGGEIVRTTSYLDEDNYQNLVGSIKLDSDGSINGSVSMVTKGIQYNDRFRIPLKSNDDITKHYKNFWSHINNLRIEDFSFKNDREDVIFTEKIILSAKDYAAKNGDYLLFPINVYNNNSFVPDRYRDRKLPFKVQRGFLDEDECKIELPVGFEINELPEKIQIQNKFGSYEMEISRTGQNELSLKRKFLLKHGNYSSDEYEAYRNFRRNVAKIDNTKIILTKLNK
jgi:transglutaminase-like putative cysteine protease